MVRSAAIDVGRSVPGRLGALQANDVSICHKHIQANGNDILSSDIPAGPSLAGGDVAAEDVVAIGLDVFVADRNIVRLQCAQPARDGPAYVNRSGPDHGRWIVSRI